MVDSIHSSIVSSGEMTPSSASAVTLCAVGTSLLLWLIIMCVCVFCLCRCRGGGVGHRMEDPKAIIQLCHGILQKSPSWILSHVFLSTAYFNLYSLAGIDQIYWFPVICWVWRHLGPLDTLPRGCVERTNETHYVDYLVECVAVLNTTQTRMLRNSCPKKEEESACC